MKVKDKVKQPEQLQLFPDLKTEVRQLLSTTDNEIHRDLFNTEFKQENSKYDSDELTEFKAALQSSGIAVKHVDNYGGEDCGSEYWSVYEFSKGNEKVFVKFNGWYQSYNGSEFEEWFFAKAVPKSGFDYVQE